MKVALDFVKAENEGKDAVMLDADGAVVSGDVEVPAGEKKKKKSKRSAEEAVEVRLEHTLASTWSVALTPTTRPQAEGAAEVVIEKKAKKSKKSKTTEVRISLPVRFPFVAHTHSPFHRRPSRSRHRLTRRLLTRRRRSA